MSKIPRDIGQNSHSSLRAISDQFNLRLDLRAIMTGISLACFSYSAWYGQYYLGVYDAFGAEPFPLLQLVANRLVNICLAIASFAAFLVYCSSSEGRFSIKASIVAVNGLFLLATTQFMLFFDWQMAMSGIIVPPWDL